MQTQDEFERRELLRAIVHDIKEPLRTARWHLARFSKHETRASKRDLQIIESAMNEVRLIQEQLNEAYEQHKADGNSEYFLKRVSEVSSKIESELNASTKVNDILWMQAGPAKDSKVSDYATIFVRIRRRLDGLLKFLTLNERVKLIRLGFHNELKRSYQDLVSMRDAHGPVQFNLSGAILDDCDQALLSTIFLNILTNSIKYSCPGRALSISSYLEVIETSALDVLGVDFDQNNKPFSEHMNVVCISDNGIGFQPEFQERIFFPFYRLCEAENLADGTGVGLAVVQSAAMLLGGKVIALGYPGVGSRFVLVLPRHASVAEHRGSPVQTRRNLIRTLTSRTTSLAAIAKERWP